jgi:hypothetical protein
MALTQVQGQMLTGSSNTTTTIQSNGTTAITIDSSQNVGIATTSPAEKLDVRSVNSSFGTPSVENSNVFIQSGYDVATRYLTRLRTDFNGVFSIATGSGSALVAPSANSPTERMRINSAGRLLLNTTTSTGQALKVVGFASNGAVGVQVGGNGEGGIDFYNQSAGYVASIVVNSSTVSYGTGSDYRLKDNIAPMTGALEKVAQLKPSTWSWKSTGEASQGFIAHELQEIVPDCVTGEKDAVQTIDELDADGNVIGTKEVPKYQGIDTSFLVATLTAAIQEQQAIITDLKARIETLEAK